MPAYDEYVSESLAMVGSVESQQSLLVIDGAIFSDGVISDQAVTVLEIASSIQSFSNSLSYTVNRTELFTASSSIFVAFTNALIEAAEIGDDHLIGVASTLSELAYATGVVSNNISASSFVASIVTAIDLLKNAHYEDVSSIAYAVDDIKDLYIATLNCIDNALCSSVADQYVMVIIYATDNADSASSIFGSSNVFADITDKALVLVKLQIDGVQYTGYVLNSRTSAVSEYSGLNINSMAQHSDEYLCAMSDGIYRMSGSDDDGADIVGYIKTGKLDFGTDALKRISKAYVSLMSDGSVMLKTITSESGKTQEHWYKLASDVVSDSPENRRINIGQGLKSRFWQFELVSTDGALVDEISVLPVVLSRRI